MAQGGFTGGDIERLDWDFTRIPKIGGGGYCMGRGVIPEPSEDALIDFQQGFDALHEAMKQARDAGAENLDVEKEYIPKIRSLLADLCDGSPTLEQLEQLSPRFLLAFGHWLAGAMGNPKG